MIRYIPGALALLFSMHCSADLRVKSSDEACALLTDAHLRGGEWGQTPDGKEGCRSNPRPLNANSSGVISFLVEGSDNRPVKVRLLVDIPAPDDEAPAKRELVKVTKRLVVRALGLSLPFPAEESIMKGIPVILPLGTGTLTISRTSGVRGHYQMSVAME